MNRIGYVSYENNPLDPDPDLDIPFLTAALENQGHEIVVFDWRKEIDLDNFDTIILRSPWNYAQHVSEFLSWLDTAEKETRIINPPEVIRTNIDKRYLFDLAKSGISTIPSEMIFGVEEWETIRRPIRQVFKPVIGAGARGAFIAENPTEIFKKVQNHFANSNTPLLVQPYLREVDTVGEIAVVCSHGVPLHAIVKRPALTEGGHGDFSRTAEITPALSELIERVQDFVIAETKVSELLYSRVDVVPQLDGFVLMELELFEPTLFLDRYPESAKIFAQNLTKHLI